MLIFQLHYFFVDRNLTEFIKHNEIIISKFIRRNEIFVDVHCFLTDHIWLVYLKSFRTFFGCKECVLYCVVTCLHFRVGSLWLLEPLMNGSSVRGMFWSVKVKVLLCR